MLDITLLIVSDEQAIITVLFSHTSVLIVELSSDEVD